MFVTKEIVWAKTKGYPWWPAQISKIPSSDHNYFKVCFIGQSNHAMLQPKAIRKYVEYYDDLKNKKFKGLQNSISLANIQMQKRKAIILQNEQKNKNIVKQTQKTKKIKKKNKKKLKIKKKNQKKKQQSQIKQIIQCSNLQKRASVQNFAQKQQKSPELYQKQNKSDKESICGSERGQEQMSSISQLDYIRNVDRSKIQSIQQELYSFITKFNNNNFQRSSECLQAILKAQKSQFKPEQLLQSKITNMISYLYKKLSEKLPPCIKKQELQKINTVNKKLKQKVVNFLFNGCYYDQYLSRMQNTPSTIKIQNSSNQALPATIINKKGRKYKRKGFIKKKQQL